MWLWVDFLFDLFFVVRSFLVCIFSSINFLFIFSLTSFHPILDNQTSSNGKDMSARQNLRHFGTVTPGH